MTSSGVRPIIFLASVPTARILFLPVLPRSFDTATTDGSLMTAPLPGTKTSTFVVPRSMPILGEKSAIAALWYRICQHCARSDVLRYNKTAGSCFIR